MSIAALPRLFLALFNAHRRAPGQALLMILALALSVAVVVAIDLAVDSARSAFAQSRLALTGSASHQIISDAGMVPDEWLAQLRSQGMRQSAPVIDVEAQHSASGRRFKLFGVDPLSETRLRPWLARTGSGPLASPIVELIGDSNAVVLPQSLARALDVDVGAPLAILVDGHRASFMVRAVLADDSLPASAGDWALVDISGAQKALGSAGYSRIDLQIDTATAARVAAELPPALRLLATADQDRDLAQLSRAFEINLQALSLLALLVGLFVVFQTFSFLTLQRRPLIGLWRALGVSRSMLISLLLGEAALVGLLAASLGILAGMALGKLLLTGISGTYAELYARGPAALSIAPVLLLKALLLALVGALLAVLLPLLEVLSQTTLQALGRGAAATAQTAAGRIRALALPSLLLFIGGLIGLYYGPQTLIGAFVALFACLLACLGLVPWLAYGLLRVLERRVNRGPVLPIWLLAGTRRGLGRTGIALAALCLAIATVIGMSSMIYSFRSALGVWIDRSLQADIYVSARGRSVLPPELVDLARTLPGVTALSRTRRRASVLDSGPVDIIGLDLPLDGRDGFDWIGQPSPSVWADFAAGDALVSEPLAHRLELQVGAKLTLPGVDGNQAVRIAAIYRDYASAQGAITLALDHFKRRFEDRSIGAIGIYASAQALPAISARLRQALVDEAGLQVISAADIRTRTLAIFTRTFAVTDLLRLLAGVIAVVAVLGALSALAIERRPEFALLRSLGLSQQRLLRLQWLQSSLLGLIAALLALPLGIGLAWLLIEVINRRSFGWSMQLSLPWGQLLAAIAIAVISAMLAGTLPARREGARSLAQQLRGGSP
jgi:putative ABC transport system permease protein